ncbi:MAG: PDDEXK nuclease domain-containing protein [Ferruginibacter sp.]
MKIKFYADTIRQLKTAILASRYKAASLANRELLILYFNVGKLISEKTKQERWGAKVLDQLSTDLQKELPGLKGFSATNIKRMRVFYEAWVPFFNTPVPVIKPIKKTAKSTLIKSRKNPISPTVSDQIQISPTASDQLQVSPAVLDQFVAYFFTVSFSHHYELLIKTQTKEERLFYVTKTATEYWSLETLKHQLAGKLYRKSGKLLNNFNTAIANKDIRAKALQTFKDEYLLDFINIEDPDDEDEREIENEIVRNIKKFVHSLGADFAFIGNQYRLIVDDEEYFIDLLFFNRKLQCLVAFELKKGKFKPEYAGKLNFYLSALDEQVKQPHEQASIGIILCKEKNSKTVEFSFRDMSKPMGVSTYKLSNQLPRRYRDALPDAETLKKLMG